MWRYFGVLTAALLLIGPALTFAQTRHARPIRLIVPYVQETLPAATLKDFIAYAKARPGKLTYGSAGTGSGQHLAGAQFHKAAALGITHIPYKGSGQAMADQFSASIRSEVEKWRKLLK